MSETKTFKSKVSIVPAPNVNKKDSQSTAIMGRLSISRMRVRKQSYGYGKVPGISPVERTSQIAMEFKRPVLLYFPTYQLDPNVPFHVASVSKICDETLDELFNEHKYNEQGSPTLALRIAGDIMRKVKALNFNRYRIISVATLSQKRAQSYNNAVTFLWDHERDNYVDTQRETTTAFVQVTVFGVYLD